MIVGNRFEIGSLLGQGGMGAVYQSVDRHSGQPVAVKRLKPELVADADLLERFAREAAALRVLNHPNIVKVLATVQEDGQHYIVMEYVGRGSLEDLLRGQPCLPVSRVLEIGLDLADALTRAHRLSIIHRDLKPANVLLADDGTPRLTDFGVARFSKHQRVTETGQTVGTLHYLSPEALNGEEAEVRTDIWAFGVMLFEMLVGQRPFDGSTPATVITAILTHPTPDLEAHRPDAPIALVDLVYRMLEKNHAQRIPSVRQVGAELEAIIQGSSTDAEAERSRLESRDKLAVTPTPTPDAPKHNLPAQNTPFIGREKELDAIVALFADPDTRLVTILGPGGMGKTRLSLEVARRCISGSLRTVASDGAAFPAFSNGVYFVPLAPTTAPEFIIPTIAEAVRFSFYEADNLARQLLDYLREKQMLLVLDNFEHVISGAALAADILKAAPGVKILVTSRERLNLTGETLFLISGMDFPDWKAPEDALRYSAARLFLQGARRVQPSFELASADLPDLAQICRLVEGMPLGIELAAAWANSLRLDEIATEIGRSLEFLETEMRDVPERHRSIRAVFEYSWAILSEAEREVFTKLSVFRGGFTRDAAIAVAGASLRNLTALVNKSLVSRDTSGRYQIHELLRQYAEERLIQSGQDAAVYEAHCGYYSRFLASLLPDMSGVGDPGLFTRIDIDLENVRASWRWAVGHVAVSYLRDLVFALHNFYQVRALYLEASDVFGKTLRAIDGLEPTAEINGLLVEAVTALGWILIRLGDIEQAKTVLKRGCDVMRLTPPPVGHQEPLSPLGMVYSILGDFQSARRCAQEALDFNLSRHDMLSATLTYLVFASAAYGLGDYQAAERYSQQGLAIAELKLSWLAAYFHVDLGNIARIMGNYAAAKQHYEACYNIRKEFNDPEGMAVSLKNLGRVALLEGDPGKAKALYEQSIVLYKDLGDRGGLATALAGLGTAYTAVGDFTAAKTHLVHTLQITTDIRLTPLTLSTLSTLIGFGRLLLQTGPRERGLELLSLVLNHPSSSHEAKEEVGALLAQPENANPLALERGKALQLDVVVRELLAD